MTDMDNSSESELFYLREDIRKSNDATKNAVDEKADSELSPLREEIRISEDARLDFLKYKLFAVATLASVALGFNPHSSGGSEHPRYVLAVIPFVCIYVDSICYHNNFRILVIAKFLRCSGDPYESFLDKWSQILQEKSGKSVGFFFQMEDWVLNISTRVLSILVMLAGIVLVSSGIDLITHSIVINQASVESITILISGLTGLILSLIMQKRYHKREKMIFRDDCAEIKKKLFSGK